MIVTNLSRRMSVAAGVGAALVGLAGCGAPSAAPDATLAQLTRPADPVAITRLQPDLLGALRLASTEAARHGIEIEVNSGWRSRKHQARLFRKAVAEYGSEAAASRWVARPGTSVHEAGAAIDVGPAKAQAWLAEHGADYGLCRVYRNEPWHYEYRSAARVDGCPWMYADPTDDPRMAS